MKNKKILALLLACTIMASGVPVYAADFSDGTAESVQDAESSLFGMEDSELTEDTMPAFADMEENADAAQITDGNSEEEDLTGDKTEDKGTEGLEYEYVPEIDGYRVKKGVNEKEIRIPEKYEGKEVLEIGEGAFAGCDQIERIRILDHHKNFKIKKDAFENCISLRKVSFFGGIKVESGAFRNCPKLYDFALINYYEGTEVSIADDAFDADSKVLVSADGGLPWKGSPEPFFNENGEDGWHEKEQGMDYWDYVKNNGPSQYEGTRVADFDNSVSKVRIRDNVKGIGQKAFYGSDRLEEVRLGKENYFIESKAFASCINLKKLFIPSATTVIEENAFENCPSLVIYTVKGSYAEKFAKKHQIPVRYSAENIQDEKIKLQVSRIKRKDDQSFTDEIRLKWNQPEMADGYLIQKKEAGGKYTTCFNIKNSDICTTTISLLTISSYYGKDISFRIRAYSTGVDGKKSYTPYSYAEVSFWPKQPEITSLTKKTDRKLTVRWKKTAHTDGYEVWRSENGKPFTCVKRITNGKTQNFTDTGLKKGVTYTYAIKSYRINSLKKKIYGDIFTQTKLKTIKYS